MANGPPALISVLVLALLGVAGMMPGADTLPLRERLSLDRAWRFVVANRVDPGIEEAYLRSRLWAKAAEAGGAAAPGFDDSAWTEVELPHDWALDLPLDPQADKDGLAHGGIAIGPRHPANSIGWYRRTFTLPATDRGRRLCLECDGAYRDATVFLNGFYAGRHLGGATPFRIDLTDLAHVGGSNVLAVRVDATQTEGWYYEGAGLYRHLWLVKTAPVHVAPWGVAVRTSVSGPTAEVRAPTGIMNEGDQEQEAVVTASIRDADGAEVAISRPCRLRLAPWSAGEVEPRLEVAAPHLWSPDTPTLYSLVTTVATAAGEADRVTTAFGIRTIAWDKDRGFLLNGQRVMIRGMSCHQDYAGVGAALPDRLQEVRIRQLREMGCNGYRSAHHPPASALLDVCDRLGMLVMVENRSCGVSDDHLGQLRSMVLRDRNHPSVILWSIANEEEAIQGNERGERIGRTMVRTIKALDPTRAVTAAINDGCKGEGFSRVVDVQGWNYVRMGDPDAWHQAHPDLPLVGSEEASTRGSRGCYADDLERGVLSAYTTNLPFWGLTADQWWTFYAARPWLAGAFVWTGFDYRGEPSPIWRWPNTITHYGVMDLCGFPKDHYYYYRSWWTAQPVLHLMPHWNWPGSEGRAIEVRAYTNCQQVELFLNGASQGRCEVPVNGYARWPVVYQPGTLEARGVRDGRPLATVVATTGPPVRLAAMADRTHLAADGQDVACITVSAVDAQGRAVPVADALVGFEVAGAGRLLGVGNGDPASTASDKAPCRHLFNGLALGLIQAGRTTGGIQVTISSEGLEPAQVEFRVDADERRP